MNGRWMRSLATSKTARAHFVLEDGTTVCQIFRDESPQLARVVGPWEQTDRWRHLCGYCRRMKCARCECSKCSAVRASDEARTRRMTNRLSHLTSKGHGR